MDWNSSSELDSESSAEESNQNQRIRTRPQALEDILDEFGPINEVYFEPFQVEDQQPAHALLPSNFPPNPHPYDFFTLFFTPSLIKTITTNTNRYASKQRIYAVAEGLREWTDLLFEELWVFIGVVIYMGVHVEPMAHIYWNTDFNTGPLHIIPTHITLRRYEQIKRYCHISCSESDEKAGYHLDGNKKWWYKVEPLASSLQASCQRYYSPSSEVSIDELMVRFFGR